MPKIALLVHGIMSGDSGSGPAKLESYFQSAGYWTSRPPVGWDDALIQPQLRNKNQAEMIAAEAVLLHNLGNEVYAVGHSNGCRILALASEYGAPFKVLTFIDGAVEKDVKIGKQVGRVLNCYTPTDPVLAIAGIIPGWGNLGRDGFPPNSDQRFWNANLGSGELPGAEGIKCTGHSSFFDPDKLPKLAAWLLKTIESLSA